MYLANTGKFSVILISCLLQDLHFWQRALLYPGCVAVNEIFTLLTAF